MGINRKPYLQHRSRVRVYLDPPTIEEEGVIKNQEAIQLSPSWHIREAEKDLEGTLDYNEYSEVIANFTPEILLGEGGIIPESAVNDMLDSVKAANSTPEMSIPRKHVGYNPPVLIEICSFISGDGYCVENIASAVREHSGDHPGKIVKSALSVKEVLKNHSRRSLSGILLRQYEQDYDREIFRESKKIPYKVFAAVLFAL